MIDVKAKIAFHEEQIRKWKQFQELMSDPEFADTARDLFLKANAASGQSSSSPRRSHMRKGRKRNLKNKALEIVRNSTSEMTAKDVVTHLEKDGFTFTAKDRAVAVSKVLRSLAGKNEIRSIRGVKPKDAIKYAALPSLINLSVHEVTH